jgi:hypothetical protein
VIIALVQSPKAIAASSSLFIMVVFLSPANQMDEDIEAGGEQPLPTEGA